MLIRFDELPSVEASLEVLFFPWWAAGENQNSLNKLFMDTVGQRGRTRRAGFAPTGEGTQVRP